MKRIPILVLFAALTALIGACSSSSSGGTAAPEATGTPPPLTATGTPGSATATSPTPTRTETAPSRPTPVLSQVKLPKKAVQFRVHVPENTPQGDSVYVMVHSVDKDFTADHVELELESPGIYSGQVMVPEGALIRYTYDRWNEEGCCAAKLITREVLFTGDAASYRLLQVSPGTDVVEDVVPQWNDLQTGFESVNVTGRVVDAETLDPLMDVEVTVGGVHVASRYDGTFTVPGIVSGPHRIVAYTVKGDYAATQQEIDVSYFDFDDIELRLERTETVPVEFMVQLPERTPVDAGVFIAGNLRQLGARPSWTNEPAIPSGISMPQMTRDEDVARITVDLPVGEYVEYFYTLGSDTVAEGEEYARQFRSFVVGESGRVRSDAVRYWGNEDWPLITVNITVPENTPDGVPVYMRNGPTYRMNQVSPFEYVTVFGSHPPGSEYSYSISLGDDHAGVDGTPGLDESGNRVLTMPQSDGEIDIDIDKWASLPDPDARGPDGSITVTFRLSIPSDTPGRASIVLTGDRPALGDDGIVMQPVTGNSWLYTADVTFEHGGVLRYRYTVAGFVNGSDEFTVNTSHDGQEVNDYVVSWGGAEDIARDGWISGIYTPDFWSEAFLPTSGSAFDAAVEANGEWVAISSVWSFGQIQPEPYLESRPVRTWTVLTPLDDIRAQAEIARSRGLKVFLAPQMNPEVHPGWQEDTISAGSREWWAQWLEQAEAQWMWNAVIAEEIGAEMLMLPGYVFHVFPSPGFFHDSLYAAEFDLAVQEMIAKVREVYSGKLLMSGSQQDYDFPGLADYIGVTTYDLGVPELSANASFTELYSYYEGRFEDRVDGIYERWGKPVMFYTIHAPAKSRTGDEYGQLFQAAAYEAMFQLIAERPHVIGSLTWAFEMVDLWQRETDGVRSRAGEAVLAKWYERLSPG